MILDRFYDEWEELRWVSVHFKTSSGLLGEVFRYDGGGRYKKNEELEKALQKELREKVEILSPVVSKVLGLEHTVNFRVPYDCGPEVISYYLEGQPGMVWL